jgi:hypothetical protein
VNLAIAQNIHNLVVDVDPEHAHAMRRKGACGWQAYISKTEDTKTVELHICLQNLTGLLSHIRRMPGNQDKKLHFRSSISPDSCDTILFMRPKAAPTLWIWLASALFLIIILIILAADFGLVGRIFAWIVYVPGQDVTAHFILIGGLAMLVNLALNRRTLALARRSIQLGSAVILLLVTFEEFSQLWIRTRGFSLLDLSADFLGVWLLGGWVSAKLHARFNPELETP